MAFISVDWRPSKRHLRGFGTACVVAFGALGAWALWRHSLFGVSLESGSARRAAVILWGLAVVCGVVRAVAPRWLRPLYVGLTAVSLPIGFVVSHAVIGFIFFGIVTPIALTFRLMGRDPLRRAFDRGAATYWTRRSPVVDLARYYRQF
jgi:Saxitoxin biosynthesis operon protein SxtJ